MGPVQRPVSRIPALLDSQHLPQRFSTALHASCTSSRVIALIGRGCVDTTLLSPRGCVNVAPVETTRPRELSGAHCAGIRFTEEHHIRAIERRSDVRGTRIVTHENLRIRDERDQFAHTQWRGTAATPANSAPAVAASSSSRAARFTTLAIPCWSRSHFANAANFAIGQRISGRRAAG